MRSQEEVQAAIDALLRRKAAIEEQYQDYLEYLAHPIGEKVSVYSAAERFEEFSRRLAAVFEQLRVLYWVTGKYEHFPVV